MIKTSPINGLVLCGGLSTRMGTDKSEIHYYNKPQRKYLYELLSSYCNEVFISCNTEQSKQINDLPVIEDVYVNIGPLGGILSAFKFNHSIAWLVVACDLPFINNETISYLIHHRNDSKMATCFWDNENKFPEPLVTIWEPQVYSFLLKSLQRKDYSPGNALMNVDAEKLDMPNGFILKNINTKEDYRKTLALINYVL